MRTYCEWIWLHFPYSLLVHALIVKAKLENDKTCDFDERIY